MIGVLWVAAAVVAAWLALRVARVLLKVLLIAAMAVALLLAARHFGILPSNVLPGLKTPGMGGGPSTQPAPPRLR